MKFFISESMPEFIGLLSKAIYYEREAIAKIEKGERLNRHEVAAMKDFNFNLLQIRIDKENKQILCKI